MENQRKQYGAVPIEALHLADQIIRRQSKVPLSPVSTGINGVELCVAAGIAAAGLELYRSSDERRKFERDLLESKSFTKVIDAFLLLGWNPQLAKDALSRNDGTEPGRRKEIIKSLIVGA